MKREYQSNLSETFEGKKEPSKENSTIEGKSFYSIDTGKRHVRRFKLYLANGDALSIPYAYLPIIKLSSKQTLNICTHDLNITIKGRNLSKIEEWLNEERVVWIKESKSSTDSKDTDVFVSEIKIESEWLD